MLVLMIVADSVRAGAPGFAGGPARTPTLDSLASGGTRFTDAFASAPWTIPSLMSMLTGVLGHRIGLCRWGHPYPARQPNLFTAFAAADHEVTVFHPHPGVGLVTVPGKHRVGDSQDPAGMVRDLREGGDHRFVFLHHWWTHLPYLHRRLELKHWHAACDFALESLNRHGARMIPPLAANYVKTIEAFSEQTLAPLLDAAHHGGRDVLTIVTSDHGETWGDSLPPGRRVEHVYDLHGRWITDETTRVPLVFHGAGVPAGQTLGGIARGVDIGPTIADLAGVPWPGPTPTAPADGTIDRGGAPAPAVGISLVECLRAGTPAPNSSADCVSSHNTHQPRTYPADGRAMWRTVARRTPEAWMIWDAVDRTREVHPHDGAAPDESATEAIFAELAAEQLAAVDSGPVLERDDAKRIVENLEVRGRLRSLGYLD